MIKIIAAMGINREIGKNNHLMWHIKEDLKFFKCVTYGKKVLMGRKTFESLRNIPLPQRENIVVSRSCNFKNMDKVTVINDLNNYLLENKDSKEDIYVIGGSCVYEAALEFANEILLTNIHEYYSDADTFFPKFDEKLYFKEELGRYNENGIYYERFRYYR